MQSAKVPICVYHLSSQPIHQRLKRFAICLEGRFGNLDALSAHVVGPCFQFMQRRPAACCDDGWTVVVRNKDEAITWLYFRFLEKVAVFAINLVHCAFN